MTKLNPTASAILWSTFVGDSQGRWERRVILYRPHPVGWERERLHHGASRTRVSHWSIPLSRPQAAGPWQVVVAELDPTGANLLFSTHIGSGGLDTANPAGLAVDSAGNIYLAGNNAGPGLITTPGAFQTDRQQQRAAATTALSPRSAHRPDSRISHRLDKSNPSRRNPSSPYMAQIWPAEQLRRRPYRCRRRSMATR